jgi:hypothetical protein
MAVVRFDALRTIAAGAITASYAAVGSATAYNMRLLKVVNNTNGDILISFDGTTDNDFISAGAYEVYDFSTNAPNINDSDSFVLAVNTQIYAKYSTAPTTGSVWITGIYARGV